MKLIPTKLLSPVASICTVAFCLSSSLLLPSQPTNAQQITRQSGSSQLVAITIPNFRPSATYSNNTLEISIPQAVIAGPIEQILRANEGRVKETEFQRFDIRNMRFSLVREPFDPCGNNPNCIPSGKRRTESVSGLRVEGQWQFQFRERLVRNPFTGKWTHTPWNSVSGSFSQPLYFQVNDSRLALQPGGLTLKGERIYKEAVAPIAGIFGVQGQIKENLRNAIQDINGMDLRQMLIEYGSQQAANQLGVNQEAVNQLISQNVGTIGARVSEGNLDLVVSVALPQSVLNLAGNPAPPTSPAPGSLASLHSSCSGDPQSPDCVAAIHRACNQRGAGGGISQEVGNGALSVACFDTKWFGDISIEELRSQHPGCDSTGKSQSSDCVAATHRACNVRGAGGGIAQELGNGVLGVACFDTKWFGDISIDKLRTQHSGCDSTGKSRSSDCVAAIHRACNVRGAGGGIAQEVGNGVLGVACFDTKWYGDIPMR